MRFSLGVFGWNGESTAADMLGCGGMPAMQHRIPLIIIKYNLKALL
jgi:hypothetical protein